jgi:hypothetical protein
MWILMGPEFRADRERYRLEFTCEDCANYVPEKEACSILFPIEPHKNAYVDALADGERIFFCKMFESF